jgi:AbiU2
MSDSNVHTAEDIRAQNVAAMGQDMGEIYSALWQQLTWLYQKWGQFVEAFGTSPERIKTFNDAAPGFFGTVQDSLWENVLLHLARLTDPPATAGKANLTFSKLCTLVIDEPLRTEVTTALSVVQKEVAFARDWRNRRIAHGDLLLSLGYSTSPLAPASRLQVTATLNAMATLLKLIAYRFLDSTTMFEFAAKSEAGGATSALYYLRACIEAEAKRRERVRSGVFEPSDLKRRPL